MKKKQGWIIFGIGLLALGIGGAWYVLKGSQDTDSRSRNNVGTQQLDMSFELPEKSRFCYPSIFVFVDGVETQRVDVKVRPHLTSQSRSVDLHLNWRFEGDKLKQVILFDGGYALGDIIDQVRDWKDFLPHAECAPCDSPRRLPAGPRKYKDVWVLGLIASPSPEGLRSASNPINQKPAGAENSPAALDGANIGKAAKYVVAVGLSIDREDR